MTDEETKALKMARRPCPVCGAAEPHDQAGCEIVLAAIAREREACAVLVRSAPIPGSTQQ